MTSNAIGNPDRTPLLEMRGISKAFGHVLALDNIHITFYSGEVIGLVGDNGAGKSTLVKILSGVYKPDKGDILLGDRIVPIRNPLEAQGMGIATVYQDLQLVDSRDVASNIYLGREPTRGPFVDKERMSRDAQAILKTLHIEFPSVNILTSELSGGQRQAVAIARTMSHDKNLFLLDEPTAALAVTETEKVMNLIIGLAKRGAAAVVIAHNLEHIFRIADRICVLRHGRLVQDCRRENTTPEEIVSYIVGAKGAANNVS